MIVDKIKILNEFIRFTYVFFVKYQRFCTLFVKFQTSKRYVLWVEEFMAECQDGLPADNAGWYIFYHHFSLNFAHLFDCAGILMPF